MDSGMNKQTRLITRVHCCNIIKITFNITYTYNINQGVYEVPSLCYYSSCNVQTTCITEHNFDGKKSFRSGLELML